MATVVVKMKFCDKTHKIDVSMRDDGDLDVHIDTDCENVKAFAEKLGPVLTMADVTEREGSKFSDPEILEPLTLTCLTVNGVMDAAWLEMGMLSKSRAKEVGSNEVSYELVE